MYLVVFCSYGFFCEVREVPKSSLLDTQPEQGMSAFQFLSKIRIIYSSQLSPTEIRQATPGMFRCPPAYLVHLPRTSLDHVHYSPNSTTACNPTDYGLDTMNHMAFKSLYPTANPSAANATKYHKAEPCNT